MGVCPIQDLLEAQGISDQDLAQRMFDGLNATIVSKETAYARREVLVDFRERREMLELVLRLKGYLTDKHEVRTTQTLEEILEASYTTSSIEKEE